MISIDELSEYAKSGLSTAAEEIHSINVTVRRLLEVIIYTGLWRLISIASIMKPGAIG